MRSQQARGGHSPSSGYARSAAFDGLRGVFIVLFLLGHFGLPHTDGLWLTLNLFFVISGFLITRLLVTERLRTGTVDVRAFYVRRVRRLVPGLLVVLAAVTLWAFTAAPEGQRHRIGGDVLATLGFVMNWRLVAQGDDYFGDFANPSPLRHAWTLAVEEQYYLLAPWLVLALVAWLRSRRRVAGALVGGAVLSTLWMIVVARGEASFPRLYYGTDIRLAALFAGTALGVALARGPSGHRPRLGRRGGVALGWAGLASCLISVVLVGPYTGWIYREGGMLLFTAGSVALVAATADPDRPRLMSAVFEARPVAWVGRRTYALYLWHWPVFVALSATPLVEHRLALGVLAFVTTFALAIASDHLVEQPVLRDGWRALLPRSRRAWVLPVAGACALTLLAGVLLRAPTQQQLAAAPTSLAAAPELLIGQPEYTGTPQRVGMVGDSVPWYLVQRFPQGLFPQARAIDLAHEGCDLLDAPMVNAFETKPTTPECRRAKETWPATATREDVEALVVWGSTLLALPHELPDGREVRLGEPAHTALVMDQLDRMYRRAQAAGVSSFSVVTVPCRRFVASRGEGELDAIRSATPEYLQEYDDPVRVNALLARWVRANPGTRQIDLYGALCSTGYQEQVQGLQVFDDGLHFAPEASPMIWRWLLGQLSAQEQRATTSR